MITLRCTLKVRKRLGLVEATPISAPPTTALGDWYVNLVRFGWQQVIMATSEVSLLTVLLPARDLRQSLVPNLQSAVRQLLNSFGIPPETVTSEVEAMQPAAFAGTVNRRVLGSMKEFAWQVSVYRDRTDDPLELARRLSETPMAALESRNRYGVPADVARELLATRHATSSQLSH